MQNLTYNEKNGYYVFDVVSLQYYNENIIDIILWLQKNVEDKDCQIFLDEIKFKKYNDALKFKLTWC